MKPTRVTLNGSTYFKRAGQWFLEAERHAVQGFFADSILDEVIKLQQALDAAVRERDAWRRIQVQQSPNGGGRWACGCGYVIAGTGECSQCDVTRPSGIDEPDEPTSIGPTALVPEPDPAAEDRYQRSRPTRRAMRSVLHELRDFTVHTTNGGVVNNVSEAAVDRFATALRTLINAPDYPLQ